MSETLAWQCASLLLAYPDEEQQGQLDLVEAVAARLPSRLGGPLLQSVTNLAARVGKNVSNASLQSSTRTLEVAGGTLFGVAASEYGDPTQWAAIAKASGLIDPTIVGLQTLKIPANPAASGGVLAP